MPVSGIRLVDSNLWLALAFSDHVHHRAAVRWFEYVGAGEAAFCRITQMALLRHLTNEKILGRFVLTQRAAWGALDKLERDERVIFLDEPPALSTKWRQFTEADHPRHKIWTDAYLAAFAIAWKIALSTVDRGFRSYNSLELDLITPA